jgi:TPP-dependent pyruvate/acetoin dehydrogenase alpha subunit
VWAWFAALGMARAIDAIDTARGIQLAFAGEDGATAIDDAHEQAFPATE